MTWPLSPLETAWCALALALGYAVRGVAGFGSGIIATPLLTFVLPLSVTAPMITVIGFFVSVRQALKDWRLIEFFKRLPHPDKQFTVMNGISHASFQQKNYLMVYQILHAYFTQPAPAYVGSPAH